MLRLLSLAVLCLALAACAGDSASTSTTDSAASIDATVVALDTYTTKCGCKIDEVGHCGNYIEIGGEFVEISNGKAHGLGPMEWCGQDHGSCEASGTIEDGKFVAKTFESKE